MKRWEIATVCLVACTATSQARKTGSVVIDLTPLRQAQTQSGGTLAGAGLLIVRGHLATLEEEQGKLDGNAVLAETETTAPAPTAPPPPKVETDPRGVDPNSSGAGTTFVVGGDTIRTTTTSSGSTPNRGATAPDVQATLAAPKLSDVAPREEVSAADVPPVSYYPITLEGSDRFSVELPAGRQQNMFLIGYKSMGDGKMMPAWVAAALDVTLQPQEDTEVVFAAYPAGVALPQFLPPTTNGLMDAAGNVVTRLPDMSCLAVATAQAPRSDFPAVSLSRVTVGSVSAQLQNAGAAGLFVLPTGHYKLDCFAAYAGKLFGVDPKAPLEFDVRQGEVTLPTAGLIKLRELPVAPDGTGGVILPPGVLPPPPGDTTTMPGGTVPGGNGSGTTGSSRFGVFVSQTANQTARSGTAPPPMDMLMSTQANFDTFTDGTLSIVARNQDGTVNTSASDHLLVSMRTAFPLEAWDTDTSGLPWQPFQTPHGAGRSFNVQLIDGAASLDRVIAFSTANATETYQYIIEVQPYDSDGRLLRRSGARYITVNRFGVCSYPALDHVEMFALTEIPDMLTVVALSSGSYNALWENVLLVGASPAPDRCAVTSTGTGGHVDLDMRNVGAAIELSTTYFSGSPSQGYALTLPSFNDSQGILWDGVRISSSAYANMPPPGTFSPKLDVNTSIAELGPMSLSVWSMRFAVKNGP